MRSSEINKIYARQIIDSRATPTVEAEVVLSDGSIGRAAVPSGASTGLTEAVELRDGDDRIYKGKSVTKAVKNIEGEINNRLYNKSFDQKELDDALIELDGTENKKRLGANALLAVSLAFAKASASNKGTTLYGYLSNGFENIIKMPRPMLNIINGGAHADNGLSFQEFMVVPRKETFASSLQCGVEIYHSLKEILKERGLGTSVGDEGGFAPLLESNEEALNTILEAGEKAGYTEGEDYQLSLDIAANEITNEGRYLHNGHYLKRDTFISELIKLSEDYPLLSIEDPLEENDESGFSVINDAVREKTMIVGDDLLVTNPQKIYNSHKEQSAGGVIIKPNQIGTVTETLSAIRAAYASDITPIVSHRSGETEDTSIAHIAIATAAPFVKFGAPARGERTAKYNELLRIEEELVFHRIL
ncbi:MAG: phosphopyruvate hydratase [Patescibacteria group bacterium]